MKGKIWRFLVQLLYNHWESGDTLKPFFENLNNENINNDKVFLQTLPSEQLEVLYNKGIITRESFFSLMPQNINPPTINNENTIIEEIISGDQIKELQEFIQVNDIATFNTITKSFKEIKKMKIPLIQYCVIKQAINCFKYLLVNGYDDPSRLMEEDLYEWDKQHLYEWDCMATAIYLGRKEFVKILEYKGIEMGRNPLHIEAAILSYRNSIAERIIEELNDNNDNGANNETLNNILNTIIMASSKSNNIKGAELAIKTGCNINKHYVEENSIRKIQHHFILQHSIIQKRC